MATHLKRVSNCVNILFGYNYVMTSLAMLNSQGVFTIKIVNFLHQKGTRDVFRIWRLYELR